MKRAVINGVMGGAIGGLLLGLVLILAADTQALASSSLLPPQVQPLLALLCAGAGGLVGALLAMTIIFSIRELYPFVNLFARTIRKYAVIWILLGLLGGTLGYHLLYPRSWLYSTTQVHEPTQKKNIYYKSFEKKATIVGRLFWQHNETVRAVSGTILGLMCGVFMGVFATILLVHIRLAFFWLFWTLWAAFAGVFLGGFGETVYGVLVNTFQDTLVDLRTHIYSVLNAGIPGAFTVTYVLLFYWVVSSFEIKRLKKALLISFLSGISLFSLLALETSSRFLNFLLPVTSKVTNPTLHVLEYAEGKRFDDLQFYSVVVDEFYWAFPDAPIMTFMIPIAVGVTIFFILLKSQEENKDENE